MDQQIFVYVDLNNTPHLVGRLWFRVRKRAESAAFRYDDEWLQNPERFALNRRSWSIQPLITHLRLEFIWRDRRFCARPMGKGSDHARRSQKSQGRVGNHRELSGNLIICSWWMMKHARVRFALQHLREGPS
jgi:hypothetical protein